MKSKSIKQLFAAALIATASISASALPMFTLTGGTAGVVGDFGLPGNGDHDQDNDVIIALYGDGSTISGLFGSNVTLNQNANLTFEFLGKDAGYVNTFIATNGVDTGSFVTGTTTAGTTFSFDALAGLLDFTFNVDQYPINGSIDKTVSNGSNNSSTIGGLADFFVAELSDNTLLIALDDGGANPDDDNHDDLVLKITAIPEPSSIALLGLGLIALGAARRRQA